MNIVRRMTNVTFNLFYNNHACMW